jgi:hypothetical protein
MFELRSGICLIGSLESEIWLPALIRSGFCSRFGAQRLRSALILPIGLKKA